MIITVRNFEKKEEKEIKKFIITLIVFGVIFVISRFLFSINFVSGNSMSDTVSDGGIVFTNKTINDFERFDIVLANVKMSDSDIEQVAIKRVIGLPNDSIKIENGIIFVNDKEIEMYNYYTEDGGLFSETVTLGEDEYFLVGDNRQNSYDSRFYGGVKKDKIIGKVECIFYKGGE